MSADDLVPLLVGAPANALGFRQGTILAWNPLTAENVVQIGNATFTNIAIFNTNEAELLSPNDNVAILTTGSGAQSWFIMGRITIPGTAAAASALIAVSNRIVAASDSDDGTRSSAVIDAYDFGDLSGSGVGPSVTVNIGSSGTALVMWSTEITRGSPVSQGTGAWVSVEISGATTRAPDSNYALGYNDNPTNESQRWSAGLQKRFTGLNPGSNTFTLKYAAHPLSSAVNVTCTFAERDIAVIAL